MTAETMSAGTMSEPRIRTEGSGLTDIRRLARLSMPTKPEGERWDLDVALRGSAVPASAAYGPPEPLILLPSRPSTTPAPRVEEAAKPGLAWRLGQALLVVAVAGLSFTAGGAYGLLPAPSPGVLQGSSGGALADESVALTLPTTMALATEAEPKPEPRARANRVRAPRAAAARTPATPTRDMPTRAEVLAAMQSVTPAVQACRDGAGPVTVAVSFHGETGRVVHAQLEAGQTTAGASSCIARAVRGAQVAPFENGRFLVHYPFR